ncbi:MAG: hypothetical protein CSA21_04435 [Deltaproteobacteria bacterium]|nr:MAG: hypothetical protein CSA21_04435 [Deltaproteobacteria bacterium]
MHKVLVLICCLVWCWGCSPLKTMTRWYRDSINPTPQVDLTIQADQECGPQGFPASFVLIDTKLERLGRDLSTQDSYPDDRWFDAFWARHAWLHSMVAVTIHGDILAKRTHSLEAEDTTIDYLSLLHGDIEDRMPKAYLLQGSSETRIALSMPFFKENIWKGCLVAVFACDTLIQDAGSSRELALLDAQGSILWGGRYGTLLDAMAEQPWKDRLKDDVRGEYEIHDKRFFWLGRFFFGTWLIYTSEITG